MRSPSIQRDMEDSAATMASRQGLSPSATSFTPLAEPHKLMVEVGPNTVTIECNLACFTLQELYTRTAAMSGQHLGSFQLSYNSSPLHPTTSKALDVGIGNYGTIRCRSTPGTPSTPEVPKTEYQQQILQLQQQIQLQQLQQQQQQLQQQKVQSQLAAQLAHLQASHVMSPASALQAQALQYSLALNINQLRQMQICNEFGLPPPAPLPNMGLPVSPQQSSPMQVKKPATPSMPTPQPAFSAPGTPTPTPPSTRNLSSPHGTPGNTPVATGCINLSAIAGQFSTFALTSAGSRALIEALRTTPVSTLTETIPTLIDDMQEFVGLVTHKYGSEVVREIVEAANQEQREKLLTKCCTDIVEISESMFGCEVLLQLVEAIPEGPVVMMVVQTISDNIYQVMTSHMARKLVVKILSKQYSREVMEVFERAVLDNLLQIAKESKGCVTMKRCIDLASQEFKQSLQEEIVGAAQELIPDQYGNYLMQHIIDTQVTAGIVAGVICKRMAEYATNKMGSHVIEKVMQMGSETAISLLVKTMLLPENLGHIIKDQYGNYIVQNAIEKVPNNMVLVIKDAIAPYLGESQFGHKIEQKIARRVKWCQTGTERPAEIRKVAPASPSASTMIP
eukprot:TRINITY_DN700_c0_g1_i1.p1 TRINITY_DN700_c0_g1~~TRINITY_DN700_c0_g1_i1.p1  ORF type:complete len:649 (+),score=165.08 TRINITY_DN700_c0_g1_i1:89-1948(+)